MLDFFEQILTLITALKPVPFLGINVRIIVLALILKKIKASLQTLKGSEHSQIYKM